MSASVATVHAERRARVMAALPPRAVLLLAGGGEVTRNADVHYRYRPPAWSP